MKIDEFYNSIKTEPIDAIKSRLLIVRNRYEQRELREWLDMRANQFAWIRLSACVTAEQFVPPADAVFASVRNAITEANRLGRVAYVTGVSAMLAIWNSEQRRSAFEQVKGLIDDSRLKSLIFVNSYCDEIAQVFSNPRYRDGNAILAVGERPEEGDVPEIRLVAPDILDLMDGLVLPSLPAFINEYEIGGFTNRPINIKLDSCGHGQSCVGGMVKQVFSTGEFLRIFCAYHGGLSAEAEDWLFAKMKDGGQQMVAKDCAQHFFFQDGSASICRDAPRMIIKCEGAEREVLVWMLRQSLASDRYLHKVLTDPRLKIDDFKSFYINEALLMIGAGNERSLQEERKEGIAAILHGDDISIDAEMAEFIEYAKNIDAYQIVPWLTNRTKQEQEECVRRLRSADMKTLPGAFFDVLPMLKHYLEPYAFGNAELEEYFTKYRTAKIANEVTAEFCETAKSIQYPIFGIKSRDDLLNEANDGNSALLVVDAMGLEYLPLILSLARSRGLGVETAMPAMVKIPTSTAFNPITWSQDRKLKGITDLDNIIHNGVHLHGMSTDEENFLAELNVFSEVIRAISQALAKHNRVVLTADHGASRLAVLANKAHLSNTLPVKGVDSCVTDWRYLTADPNVVPPVGVASNLSRDKWVVKGYDRFSKSGGKLNELHGGLTYEEVLVPFVVFKQGAGFIPMPATKAVPTQFVENKDFDF